VQTHVPKKLKFSNDPRKAPSSNLHEVPIRPPSLVQHNMIELLVSYEQTTLIYFNAEPCVKENLFRNQYALTRFPLPQAVRANLKLINLLSFEGFSNCLHIHGDVGECDGSASGGGGPG
jgi:hypothetical protein